MKKIIIFLALLALVIAGCATVEKNVDITESDSFSIEGEDTISEGSSENDIRLASEGFEITETALNKGESLTIIVVDDIVSGHYLTIDGHRVSSKDIGNGDKINIPFDTEGIFEILDENSGATLSVNVK